MAIDLNSPPDEGHGEMVLDLNKAAPVDEVEHVEMDAVEEHLHTGTHRVLLLLTTCRNS